MKIGLEVLNEPAKGSGIEKNNNDDFATIMTEIRDNEDLFIDIVEETAICNESGSHDRSPQCPNCGTWKKHWVKITGKEWPSFCSNSECLNNATVGGHVVFANDKKGRSLMREKSGNWIKDLQSRRVGHPTMKKRQFAYEVNSYSEFFRYPCMSNCY